MTASDTARRISASLDARVTDRLRIALAPSFSYTNEALQYVQHLDTSSTGSGYIVGRLRQTTASLTARVDLAITQRATLQLYAQPLIGSARYRRLRRGGVAAGGEHERARASGRRDGWTSPIHHSARAT